MSHRLATTSKLLKLIAAAALGASALAAQAVELRGFRGISWGEAAVQLGEADAVSQEGDVTCYRRERENLLFGDTAVSGVQYCFHQDRLFLVSIESDAQGDALAGEFQRTYGEPQQVSAGRKVWAGKPGAARAELLPVVGGQPGSTLTLYATQFDRVALSKTLARIAAAPAHTRVAYLAK
jgi:hypothetical protein